jgi:hypothetical protein
LRIVVENTDGDIFDPAYLETLKRINDELVTTPGVDRAWMKSLWMPAVRWTEVTEEGFRGGPVMPDGYDGSPPSVEQLRRNIARSGIVGQLVAADMRSTMLFVPLLDRDAATGNPLDYRALSRVLDRDIRDRHELSEHGPKSPRAHHRLRQGRRRAHRRARQGAWLSSPRPRSWPPRSSISTRAACAARRWSSRARSSPWSGSWASWRGWASSSIPIRSWCRSSSSPSAYRTARRR